MRKTWSAALFKFGFVVSLILLIGLTMGAGVTAGGMAAWAKEPATPELTLQQAVERAIANSKSLKNKEYEIERTEEVRESAADKVKWTPSGPISDEKAAEAASAFTGLVSADLQWQMAKKSYDAEVDTVTMSVTKAYYSVLQALENVRTAELDCRSAELAGRLAMASYRAGALSKSGLIQADSRLAGAKSALEAAQKALDDAYQQFNQLVGLWPEDRPVLTDRPSFSALEIDNLETEVERAVEKSPTLWQVKRSVELAKLDLDLYAFNYEAEPYKSKEIKVNQAEVSASAAEEQMRNAVRTIYYNIRQLEDSYAGLQQQLAAAEENLRVTQLKYELGMATKADVLSAQASLAGVQKSLLDTVCQHELLKLSFAKPWA
ncbi:MAG: TolC family protein [Armatimonadetes bacterium]|nr:TolC family protein [Armatimonadota bacterium]